MKSKSYLNAIYGNLWQIAIAVDLQITCNMSWNLRENLHNQKADTNARYI